ncbi:MAG: hypothetical protein ACK56I_23100 [bacterium]
MGGFGGDRRSGGFRSVPVVIVGIVATRFGGASRSRREGFDSLLDDRLQHRQHHHHHPDDIPHVFRRFRFVQNWLNIAGQSGGSNENLKWQ